MDREAWNSLLPLRDFREASRELDQQGCDQVAKFLRAFQGRRVLEVNGHTPRTFRSSEEYRLIGAFMVAQWPDSPSEMELTVEGIEGLEFQSGSDAYVRREYERLFVPRHDVTKRQFGRLSPAVARVGLLMTCNRRNMVRPLCLYHPKLRAGQAVNLIYRGLVEYTERRRDEVRTSAPVRMLRDQPVNVH